MNILDVVKTVGTGLLSTNPLGAAALVAYNKLAPDGAKLPETATGLELEAAVNKLTPEQRIQLESQKLELAMTEVKEGNATVRMMIEADAKNPHSTRPFIALGCFWVLAIQTLAVALGIFWAIVRGDAAMVAAMGDLAVLLIGLTATFAVILKSYFGILSNESRDRQNAANGFENTGGLAALAGKVLKR